MQNNVMYKTGYDELFYDNIFKKANKIYPETLN